MRNFYSLLLLCLISGSLLAEKPMTCNERMRYGPRGAAQAIAALAGFAVLYNAKDDILNPPELKFASRTAVAKQYARIGGVLGIYLWFIWYFGTSAVKSLSIFFTDDEEPVKPESLPGESPPDVNEIEDAEQT